MEDDLVALEMLEARLGIKVADLSGDQDLEVLDVEAPELPHPDLGATAAGPEVSHARANGGHCPQASNDHAPWSA